MRYKSCQLFVALLCFAFTAGAKESYALENQLTALTFSKHCENGDDVCSVYIAGVVHMHDLFAKGKNQYIWCAPDNVAPSIYINIYIQAARSSPQLLYQDYFVFMIQAFKAAYPCMPGKK